MSGKVNVAAAMMGEIVSKLDTSTREQLEYIDIDLLDEDEGNFYELSGIEDLAANIQFCGRLLQPIRVRAEEGGRYRVSAGHRRRAALKLLVKAGNEAFREVPAIVERTDASPALQKLRLIFANSDNRELTDAELSKQAEEVELTLYQLKEEGMEFPGRMRDQVAAACKVSATKLATLKVIRDNLIPEYMEQFERGKDPMNASVAYEMAKLPEEDQRKIFSSGATIYAAHNVQTWANILSGLSELSCADGSPCHNKETMWAEMVQPDNYSYMPCKSKKSMCCKACSCQMSCKAICAECADKVKAEKDRKRLERKSEIVEEKRLAEEKKQTVMSLWRRFGEARRAADISLKDSYCILGHYWYDALAGELQAKENGTFAFKDTTHTPYYGTGPDVVAALAERLGCSVDFLFCRTDIQKRADDIVRQVKAVPAAEIVPPVEEAVAEHLDYAEPDEDVDDGDDGVVPDGVWHRMTEKPQRTCWVMGLIDVGTRCPLKEFLYYCDGTYYFDEDFNVSCELITLVAWTVMPKIPEWAMAEREGEDDE